MLLYLQFSTFGNSVEILFALLNGDSIWITFRAFNSNDTAIYVYSRLFVYAFISLFIYAVLNLFTSLVKASYEDSIVSWVDVRRMNVRGVGRKSMSVSTYSHVSFQYFCAACFLEGCLKCIDHAL